MSRRRVRAPSGEELKLWRAIARTVAPLDGQPPLQAESDSAGEAAEKPPKPAAAPGKAAARPPSKPTAPPPLSALDRRLKSRIVRGTTPIDARIDLHGLTQAAAHVRLTRFLHAAQADGAKLVLVITGKGRSGVSSEEDRGVLRRAVPLWLGAVEMRTVVVGFEAAGRGHGGDGALYVRLRRKGRSQ